MFLRTETFQFSVDENPTFKNNQTLLYQTEFS